MPQVSYWRIVFLFSLVVSLFFVELGTARLWDRDEPRNARASHEMLARGDWIVPTFNGNLRDHKPILLYWGQMLSYLAFGESEFTARLPSALCALLTIVAIAVLGSRLSGKSHGLSADGFWSAGCLATCGLFVMAGRAATPDACLIAFSTLGIAALVISALAPAPPYSSGNVGRARWIPAMLGYTMLGLAALAKGPVGVILPLAVVHVWWMICYRLQTATTTKTESSQEPTSSWSAWIVQGLAFTWGTFNPLQVWRAVSALRTIPGLLLTLLAAAPWYVAVGIETNGQFLRGFFLDHNVGRAVGAMEGHNGSILFYPLAFLIGTFPWSMWLIPVVMWCYKASGSNAVHRQITVLSGVWIAVYVTAFTAASTKLPSYITPCYAGAALALGSYWQQFESGWSRPTWKLRHIAYVLTIFVGVGLSVGMLWVSRLESMPLLARVAWGGMIIVAVGAVGIWWELTHRQHRLPLAWLAGAAAFQLLLFGFGSKSVDSYRHDIAALTSVEGSKSASVGSADWISIGGLEPSWVHYLGHEILEVTTPATDDAAWHQLDEFVAQHPQARLIVVGTEAQQRFLTWQTQRPRPTFVELARASRFLRPGEIHVYGTGLAQDRHDLGDQAELDVNVEKIGTGPAAAVRR
jgi:4-amino-4-deoxy-L-arabinose transferase-like glycosyltransferase